VPGGSDISIFAYARKLDVFLLAVPKRAQYLAMAATLVAMVCLWAQFVPRPYLDYAHIPVLRLLHQDDVYGDDTISEMYESKVILNDPSDMYTKKKLDQTPLESSTWSKEQSGPYPPAVLLTEAGLYRVGEWTGAGFYGMILGLACLFLTLSAWCFLRSRWYLFPLLYLSGRYIGYRFVYVQDCTYLVMLTVVMAALLLARRRREAAHPLMALAITMKLLPLYYAKNILTMKRPMALLFVAILIAGLVLPYFIWDNYLYIYTFQNEFKGTWSQTAGAILVAVPFAMVLCYVETRLAFDLQDRIGWGLVPFALFAAIKMNTARHLLIVLLVPDKRGIRNVAAAIGMAVPSLLPWFIRFNSSLFISTAVLVAGFIYYLERIGWAMVRDDVRHPGRTALLMLRGGIGSIAAISRAPDQERR
jgi:hypothetical protein